MAHLNWLRVSSGLGRQAISAAYRRRQSKSNSRRLLEGAGLDIAYTAQPITH